MELLLASSFDQLSSYDPSAVRRGLRHIEGLLAHICRPSPDSDHSLLEDPAYCEFLRLQDGFEWNLTLRLLSCLERLLGQPSSELQSLLIISALDLIQGVLLIHPPSRRLFSRSVNMTIFLDLLDPMSDPSVQSATMNALVCALVNEWANVRTFETLDGLATVCTLFRRKETDHEVKLKILEFLFCYLVPESSSSSQPESYFSGTSSSHSSPESTSQTTNSQSSCRRHSSRTTQEKQKMLGKYLNNVDSIVSELRKTQPYGELMI
ncbi:cell division protein Cdc14 [Limtongia smithiae]|uniref:cell division protein Cdc14 n=1 Tax=Limtongia smithiae TaxID=1125753 RepID=UPI0034CEA158